MRSLQIGPITVTPWGRFAGAVITGLVGGWVIGALPFWWQVVAMLVLAGWLLRVTWQLRRATAEFKHAADEWNREWARMSPDEQRDFLAWLRERHGQH